MFKFKIVKHPLFLGIILLSSCYGHAQKLIFTPVKILTDMDTTYIAGKKYISKQEVYLVENYSDDSTSLKAIDSFVNKNKDTTALKTYNQYSITFYKKSSETNVENIKVSKRVIDRYSNQHDLLYGYSWYQSKFLYRSKYKDGTMVEPSINNITVTDPPK